MQKPFSPIHRIGFILLVLVLLPAIFYSVYEITALSTTEELISRAYRQQLDAILFSVNQHAWDIASVWANRTTELTRNGLPFSTVDQPGIDAFLANTVSVKALFSSDTLLKNIYLLHSSASKETSAHITKESVLGALKADSGKISRLIQQKRQNYRRIESFALPKDTGHGGLIGLVFLSDIEGHSARPEGMIIDPRDFVRDVIGQKLVESAGDDFVLAVIDGQRTEPVFVTGPGAERAFEQKKTLWLFPDYSLAIQLKGTPVEHLTRSLFYRNLVLIILLNIVLIAGAWLIFRTLRREMELVRLKSDFVSNVSHELRTPLSLIRMFAETLEMNRVPTEVKKREYYATIVEETDRLTRLVNNILNFSRMEAGKKEYHLQPVDLNEIVERVSTTYTTHLHHTGFTFSVKQEAQLPIVLADPEAVSEALINIIDNAVKYSLNDKWVEVRTEKVDGKAIIAVEDHGMGIAPADQKKIFEKFYRVSSALVHNTKGSGLGLTLVDHIMRAHRGEVVLTSTPKKGSTFRLVFPVTPPEEKTVSQRNTHATHSYH